MGSVEICGEYGPKLTKLDFDSGPKSSDEGNICPPYHRQRYISRSSDNGKTVKSSETSWIAVRGREYICIVTGDIAQEKLDLSKIFSDGFCGPESAIVSVVVDSKVMGGGYAASFAEFNEKAAIYYLRKIFRSIKAKIASVDKDIVKIAVRAFCRLHSWNVKADEAKISVLEKDNQTLKALSMEEIMEAFSCDKPLEAEVWLLDES